MSMQDELKYAGGVKKNKEVQKFDRYSSFSFFSLECDCPTDFQ